MMNSRTSRQLAIATFTTALIMGIGTAAIADDIDVFTPSVQQKPNILFLLDFSSSMEDILPSDSQNRRMIDILKESMYQVLDDNVDFINAGLGSPFTNFVTGIRWPISELNADASTVDSNIPTGQYQVADIIKRLIDERDAYGGTATVDALVEATQYFRGDAVTHNDADPADSYKFRPGQWNITNERYEGGWPNAANTVTYSPSNAFSYLRSGTWYCNDYSGSGGPNFCENKSISNCTVMSSTDAVTVGYERFENFWGSYQRCEFSRVNDWEGARYNSPITRSCQANAIVLISDGKPSFINDGESLRSVVGGNGLADCEDLKPVMFSSTSSYQNQGNCGPEVVRTLATTDQNPKIPNSHVVTYTVGFNIDGPGQSYLQRLAAEGNGDYFFADKPEELADALSAIVSEVVTGSETFTQLSIDIDKANFSHDNRAFFSLFSPSPRRSWKGNLKGYFLKDNELVDINGNIATTTSDLGFQFVDNAQSFWSDDIDGNDVTAGGANEQLVTGTRKLYTYTGGTIPSFGAALASTTDHRIESGNSKITDAMLGLPNGSPKRVQALDWIATAPMGDPLHSKSVQVNYGNRQVVYVMTNQGLLHAIDASSPTDPTAADTSGGEEIFAYMPPRLLRNLPALMDNTNSGGHIYGLDGSITRWHTDSNNDGIVNNGERLLLILGMRRGGTAYHALDLSDPDIPRLNWVIDDTHADFPRLAQSWSRMSLVKVRDGGSDRQVLAFAAGYDADKQDDVNAPVASKGNAIYMVDERGNRLWKVDANDHADMQYSIASDLTIIDSDRDSYADRIYVGDVGGQLWRIDFDDIDDTPTVTLLADLDDGDHQPFFYPPSVAMNREGRAPYLSVSIGSGNRTNPMLTGMQNNLYMIRDTDVEHGAPDTSFSTIRVGDLYDASNDAISSADATDAALARSQLNAARGWRIALRPNEKALSRLVTFEGTLLATTFDFSPPSDPTNCKSDTLSRLYQVSVTDAVPILGMSNSGSNAGSDPQARITELEGSGIPSAPVLIFPKGEGTVQVMVDRQTVNTIDQTISRVYWHAK